MYDLSVVAYARERWRVVRTADPGQPLAYVVVDTAGIELRRELSLDDARAWVDDRVIDGHARTQVRKPIR